MTTFKKTLLSAFILTANSYCLALSDNEKKADADIDEVIVTGIHANLKTAQNIKKNADTVVDSISSEDINSLPDRSVLDAMQRIPGVTIERFAVTHNPDRFSAEGSSALVRGMTNTRSEFNGRDSFSANSGRGLNFQDVSPVLMAGVDVYKNQTADMIEGGIGGTVSLRTRKPFDTEGRHFAISAETSSGDLTDKWAPSTSALYSDRWQTDAGEFGLLLNAAHSELNNSSHGLQSSRYAEYRDDYTGFARFLEGDENSHHAGPNDIAGGECFAAAGQSVWMPSGNQAHLTEYSTSRKGYVAALQWENPAKTFSSSVQFIRSDAAPSWKEYSLDSHQDDHMRQAIPLAGTAYSFNDQGFFQQGTITQDGRYSNNPERLPDVLRTPNAQDSFNGSPVVAQFGQSLGTSTRIFDTHTLIDDYAINLRWAPNEQWEFNLDVQYINATANNADATIFMTTAAITTVNLTGKAPTLAFTEPWHGLRDNNLSDYGIAGAGTQSNGNLFAGFSNDAQGDHNWFQDPTSYLWGAAMDHYDESDGTSKAARFDTTYHLDNTGALTAIKTGIRYANRLQTVSSSWYNYGNIASQGQIAWADADAMSSLNEQWQPIDWSHFYREGAIDITNNTLLHPSDALVKSIIQNEHKIPTEDWSSWLPMDERWGVTPGTRYRPSEIFVTEETNNAAYLRFDFESELAEHRVKTNVGLRYMSLERIATGSVQYPDLIPRELPPTDAPAVNDMAALNAWEIQKKASYVLANPESTPEQQDMYLDTLTAFRRDISNFLSPSERAFANGIASSEYSIHPYHALLPSFNSNIELTKELLLRVAAAKALAMPDIGDTKNTSHFEHSVYDSQQTLDNNFTIPRNVFSSASIIAWQGSDDGNPALEPMESNQYDASLEWYFATVGSLTMSIFKKDLSNFFVHGAIDHSYTNPVSGATKTATVVKTINNGKGELHGAEFAYQQFYDMLPAPFDGLGLQFNYTYINSKSIPNTGSLPTDEMTGLNLSLPLQGQSKNTYNLIAMYEKYDWSVRLAYNWRSRYLLTTSEVNTRYPLWNETSGFLDGSIFYNINKNITAGMEFNNLLNAQTKTTIILNGQGLEATRSWFTNDRRMAFLVRANF